MVNKQKQWQIGIDEAGRGPLAGPVAVGVVLVPVDFDWNIIPGVGDSKKITAKNREVIYQRAKKIQRTGQLAFVVEMVSARLIDKVGISPCIKKAIAKGLSKLEKTNFKGGLASLKKLGLGSEGVMIKLDGSLSAPPEYLYQETIIRGDAKEKVIGLASIMAKVTRDRYMKKIATKPSFAVYDFARHKGYGTKIHREAIAKNGLSLEHRVTYCRNIKVVV